MDFKEKLIIYYKKNKIKLFITQIIIVLVIILFAFLQIKKSKNNNVVAEKFIEAGLLLSSNQKDLANQIYEEVIFSKNKFYSILALNTILEKDLVSDTSVLLNYFKIVETIKKPTEQQDRILFRKALLLIKISKDKEGNNILKKLIDENSKLKPLAEEIIVK